MQAEVSFPRELSEEFLRNVTSSDGPTRASNDSLRHFSTLRAADNYPGSLSTAPATGNYGAYGAGGFFAGLNMWYLWLFPLIFSAIVGNLLGIILVVAVAVEKKLRTGATNKFIASLAVSDLLVGVLVMPFALYIKMNDDQWELSEGWCKFHLCSTVFSTAASILHLVAISLDRYFAIIFPTEYQRHITRTRSLPYLIMIWVVSLLMSVTIFLEKALNDHKMCWIEDPQYLILSTLISFILPAIIVCFLYSKIFRKLRRHLSIFWALKNRIVRKRTPPAVIVEEIRSRRGSNVNSIGGDSKASTGSRTRSVSQPDIAGTNDIEFKARFRSPTISGDTLRAPDASETTIEALEPPEPPSRRVSIASTVVAFHRRTKDSINHVKIAKPIINSLKAPETSTTLTATYTPPLKLLAVPQTDVGNQRIPNPDAAPNSKTTLLCPATIENAISLAVPKNAPGTRPSCTSVTSGSSITTGRDHSLGSSFSDDNIETLPSTEAHSRRVSTMTDSDSEHDGKSDSRSLASRKSWVATGGKLRKIASQVTKAIRRKRRESAAIRRETRATRVVAAILVVFIICWLPYFCASIYRGVCLGLNCSLDYPAQIQVYLATSWLGYAHSVFNPIIYTALNKNFRSTFKKILGCRQSRFRNHLQCFPDVFGRWRHN